MGSSTLSRALVHQTHLHFLCAEGYMAFRDLETVILTSLQGYIRHYECASKKDFVFNSRTLTYHERNQKRPNVRTRLGWNIL